jgi:glucokinase
LDSLATLADECTTSSKADAPLCFGIAAAALVDSEHGKVSKSPNIPVLDGAELARELSERCAIPVLLENDSNAAAVGEQWLGALRGHKHAVCITLGTGVGGGIIIDNQLYRGAIGTAGEIGHMGVESRGRPCTCGSVGCLEQYASATAIVRLVAEHRPAFADPVLLKENSLTSLDVYNAAARGDALSLEVFRVAGFYLGNAIASLVNVLDPEAVVIGGGVAAAWDMFIGPLRHQLQERAFREPAENVKIVRAELGDKAGLLGVAKLALNR